jgi:tricorn protease
VNRVLSLLVLLAVLLGGAAFSLAADANEVQTPGWVMRYADIGGGQIVFTYEGDLWLVPDTGGDARRITSDPGTELAAKISRDGKLLAFTGGYDGGNDVYVMDLNGGVPRRLTFHPSGDLMLDWCPDDQGVIISSNREYPNYSSELYRVPVDGGMPMRLPTDRGSLAAVAPDHSGLAYNRIGRHVRTWKRYEGGLAQDIWVKDLKTQTTTKITDWQGTDQFPMWEGKTIYFASDREDGTLNIYGYDTETKQTERLTFFTDYDVKYPSIGDGQIVFQYGPGLSVLDLATRQVREVPINIPSDRRHVREELITPAPRSGSFSLSPAGERVLIEARGEILNLPADEGDPVNITGTSGTRERGAVWAPDGSAIAMISDRTGEQQLYLVDQLGRQDWRQLTDGEYGFILPLVWSPDSKSILFTDKFMRLHLVDVKSGKTTEIAHSDYDDAWERWGIQDYVWSPDSRWVCYTSNGANMNENIYLYDTKTGATRQVTDAMTTDWSPSFSADGQYLFFLSNRTFNPIMGRQDQNHVFLKMAAPYVVLLQEGARSPFYKDDVLVETKTEAEADDKKDEKKATPAIDIDGIAGRVVACEGVEAGNYFRLEAIDGGFLMLRKDDPEFIKYQNVNDHTGGSHVLVKYSLEDAEPSDLMDGVTNYHLSADGKKMIYRAGSSYGVVDTGKEAKQGDGKVDPGQLKVRLDRLVEFEQIFHEAWRVQRDWFYDANMQGVDWPAMYKKYQPFVAGCGTRGDLNYLIGEMIGELNLGHTYIYGGDYEDGGDRVMTGTLGARFAPDPESGYYKISAITPSESWNPDARSPLAEPGVNIKVGDYLLAIDGVAVKVGDNIFERLVDRAGRMVTLTTNAKPEAKGAVETRLETLRGDGRLQYRAWVNANLDYVTEKSGGRIGYLHMPNMGEPGLREFGRYYYPQTEKEAIIIDDRWNGGGFVGDMVVDRLERRLWAMTAPREGKTGRNPERVHHGPVVVLINEDTYSNGEFFAETVKRKNLATLIGLRTWGGSTGIEPHQDLIDGGTTTPPQFGLYGLDGSWPIEGWGVEPHIVVVNLPDDVVAGKDAQLDKAIEFLLEQLDTSGGKWDIPETPPYPIKAKPYMSKGK